LGDAPHILATGGGAFIDTDTRARIKEKATSVWLKAPVELLLARTQRRDTRPLLKNADPRETLERLLNEREPVYALADLTIDTEDGPHQIAVERILEALRQRGTLSK
jgi:shikimate kinase